MGEVREKCAVVATFGENATEYTALALKELDHRGPDSTGLGGITDIGEFKTFSSTGRAKHVFTSEQVSVLGDMGLSAVVGHNRYPTSGGYVEYPVQAGILYAENGNSSLLEPLEKDLYQRGIDTTHLNDGQMKAWAIGDRVRRGASVVEAIADTYPLMVGAHASVISGKGLSGQPMIAAFRDRRGLRPLVLGSTEEGGYMVASETTGLDAAGATYIQDVPPGGLVTIDENGLEEYELADCEPKYDPFEILYFSNKNSLFNGVPIGDIRTAIGAQFVLEHGELFADVTAVQGIPNSGNKYAKGFSEASGVIDLVDALKKVTDDRTFLQATLKMRQDLRDKTYVYDQLRLRGHHLAAFDDTLVRNNTAPKTRQGFEEIGNAASVSFAIGAPPIIYPNFYGINLPTQAELTAANKTVEEIREDNGAKRLAYLSLDGLAKVLSTTTGIPADHFDFSAFNGDYPEPIGERGIRTIKLLSLVA